MLKGIDISSWQDDIDLRSVIESNDLNFVVIKATEGSIYVESTCDYWVQTCKTMHKLWGFYHFAFGGSNTPEEEAEWFYANCFNYFGQGVPVLDIEKNTIDDWGTWCQRFVDRLHALSGVYPLIYCSSSQLGRFNGTQLPKTCGLWVAQYPYYAHGYDDIVYDDGCWPWEFVAVWQFTSQGLLDGYPHYLDLNYAYMDEEAWHKYADPEGNAESGNTGTIVQPTHVFDDESMHVEVTLK
jgi:lysozyme